ncbi:transposase [Dactylosporangium darangshiense]|uniref:Transposase IS701-like DDE domain-containing protein n=1 Tax=Dactylosporangium darangshiense TaxID=579108 RepID=A0ABP8DVB3_9ACTN
MDAGPPPKWVTADEAYGKEGEFRLWLQQPQIGYVLAVPCNQKVPTERGGARADGWAAARPPWPGNAAPAATAWRGPGSTTGRSRHCPTRSRTRSTGR